MFERRWINKHNDRYGQNRDVTIPQRSDFFQSINETHKSYDVLQYPMIFCRGENGYDINIRMKNHATGIEMGSLSAMNIYAHRYMIRSVATAQSLRDEQNTSSNADDIRQDRRNTK